MLILAGTHHRAPFKLRRGTTGTLRCILLLRWRVVATRRQPIRTRRLRRRAATYLRICHEATQRTLEEHRRHWGGAVKISVVRIRLMPPCYIAWLVI